MTDTLSSMQGTHSEMHLRRRADWRAIWGGAFVFASIWVVFESLALAIFGVPAAMSAMGAGLAVWTIVLTIIAMYIAGAETGRLSGATTSHDGLVHGLMMFGLSVFGVIALATLAGGALSTTAATHATSITSGVAWSGFLTLILGWLAAMGGAASVVKRNSAESRQPVAMRPAA